MVGKRTTFFSNGFRRVIHTEEMGQTGGFWDEIRYCGTNFTLLDENPNKIPIFAALIFELDEPKNTGIFDENGNEY